MKPISLLEQCRTFETTELAEGDVVIAEGQRSDRLCILVSGTMEVCRKDVTIAVVSDPGAVFGEMSVLLNCNHTASVRAVAPSRVHLIEGAEAFLADHPDFLLPIASLLALRLNNASAYLVDLKRQYQDQHDHFAMVDEVLDSLLHQQNTRFTEDDELPADP